VVIFDPYLIWLFRITGSAPIDFIIGTTTLVLVALILGKISNSFALVAGRRYLKELNDEVAKYQDLSIKALKAGDKPAYRAANKLANEAFGKSFFLGMAQSAAFFWPVGLVLTWMQYRFQNIELLHLPGTDLSIGFVGVFILMYIMIVLLVNLAKRQLFHHRRLNGMGRSSLNAPDLPKAG